MMEESKAKLLDLAVVRERAEKDFGLPEPISHTPHHVLLGRLRTKSPTEEFCRAEVAAFSGWVYEQDRYPNGRPENILARIRREENYRRRAKFDLGKSAEPEMVEKYIAELRKQDTIRQRDRDTQNKARVGRVASQGYRDRGWEMVYDGTSTSNEEAKTIRQLTFRDMPLRAKPDLVFRDRRSGDILIVELKTLEVRGRVPNLPLYGWANAKVQLWCYGHIDWFERPANLYLQCHVWAQQYGELDGRFWILDPRRFDDPRVQHESQDLFLAFGGAIET